MKLEKLIVIGHHQFRRIENLRIKLRFNIVLDIQFSEIWCLFRGLATNSWIRWTGEYTAVTVQTQQSLDSRCWPSLISIIWQESNLAETLCSVPGMVKVPDGSIGSFCSNERGNDQRSRQPGECDLNGLWVPGFEAQNTDANVNQIPLDIIHTVPVVVHHPSSICQSACSIFTTVQPPELSLHQNYFIPNNNHYFYYFTRLHEKLQDVQTADVSNFCPNSADYFSQPTSSINITAAAEPMDSPESLIPIANATFQSDIAHATQVSSEAHQYTLDQMYVTDLPSENNDHAAHRYPGYGFGHPVHSLPLCVLFPSSVNSQALPSAPSWSTAHLQKRRRRRRKGYAEYAVIPRKKNVSQNFSKEAIEVQKDAKNSSAGEKQDTGDINCHEATDLKCIKTNSGVALASDSTQKNDSTSVSEVDANKEYISRVVSPKIILYVNDLVENVIKQGIKKFLKPKRLNTCLNDTSISVSTNNHQYADPNDEIVNEILQSILNQISEETIRNVSSFIDITAAQKVKTSSNQRDPFNKEQCQNPHGDDYLNGTTNSTKAKLSNHELRESPCRILPISDSPEVEINDTFTEPNLKMDVPQVHKNAFSNLDGESTLPHEEFKNEIHGVSATTDEIYNRVTDTAEILQRKTVLAESSLTSDIKNNHEYLSRSPVVDIFANNDRYNNLRRDNSDINENIDDFELGSCDDRSACVKSELPTNSTCSDDYRPLNQTPPMYVEAMPKQNRHFIVRSSTPHNELNENHKCNEDSPSSQYGFVSHSVSSDVLIRETEIELNKLHQLTANSNQSIYKLAYDENITDQSETEDLEVIYSAPKDTRTCPESCKNLQTEEIYRSEILVHEVDSASDAGSEDVELLPHRYESDTAKGCNKHVYVNNLSLAVELLRTRESLPYDDEFKRIVNDDVESKLDGKDFHGIELKPMSGRVNQGFVEDLSPSKELFNGSINIHDNPQYNHQERSGFLQANVIVQDKPQHREFRHSIADSGVQSEASEDEIGEEAKEAFDKQSETLYSSNENSSYHSLGARTRKRFNIYTPNANVMNPCFCCVIM